MHPLPPKGEMPSHLTANACLRARNTLTAGDILMTSLSERRTLIPSSTAHSSRASRREDMLYKKRETPQRLQSLRPPMTFFCFRNESTISLRIRLKSLTTCFGGATDKLVADCSFQAARWKLKHPTAVFSSPTLPAPPYKVLGIIPEIQLHSLKCLFHLMSLDLFFCLAKTPAYPATTPAPPKSSLF